MGGLQPHNRDARGLGPGGQHSFGAILGKKPLGLGILNRQHDRGIPGVKPPDRLRGNPQRFSPFHKLCPGLFAERLLQAARIAVQALVANEKGDKIHVGLLFGYFQHQFVSRIQRFGDAGIQPAGVGLQQVKGAEQIERRAALLDLPQQG